MFGESDILDLSGEWSYETDLRNKGIVNKFYNKDLKNKGFSIPGSTCDNGIGKQYLSKTKEEDLRCLRERYEYIGPFWIQRKIYIPPSFCGKNLTMVMERVNMTSMLWIDGKQVGRKVVSLSVPHRYNITDSVSVGIHTITIRLDNTDIYNIQQFSSGYSRDTQGMWCGIIGKVFIEAKEKAYVKSLSVFFKEDKSIKIKTTVYSPSLEPNTFKNAVITLNITDKNGTKLQPKEYRLKIRNSCEIFYLDYEFSNKIYYWDEFEPNLYKIEAELLYDNKYQSSFVSDFGIRSIYTVKNRLFINNKPVSLRGTLDCGIYPITGYPPTSESAWENVFKTIKNYGLNHIRFHCWCPPKAAFEAADKIGIYIMAEMPAWINHDISPIEFGEDTAHQIFYLHEAMSILSEYGNHPSFIMFSNGNELLGNFEVLENITTQLKAIDNRRLYTLTSNFERNITPADDFICAVAAAGKRIRMQVFYDIISEHTKMNYQQAIDQTPVPVISFEIGQYCIYPDVDSVNDYTGNMVPINFQAIKADMINRKIYHKLRKYVYASGVFACLLYKEEIECALRTKNMGGFQILGLTDYTGQGTATVGLLDVFWKSKGIIPADKFRMFCSDFVPLLKANRIFYNTENFEAEFDVYDFTKAQCKDYSFLIKIYDKETCIYENITNDKNISIPLDFINKPSMLRVELEVNNHINSWTIFVYPDYNLKCNIPILKGTSKKLKELIEKGGKAIVIGDRLKKPIPGQFRPAFWSPVFFKTDRSCGFFCDSKHPVFEEFPTESTANFQWKEPVNNCINADISNLPDNFKTIIENVPNFWDNTPASPMFECRAGEAEIFFCGFDLHGDDKSSKQLRNSIFKYVNSKNFNPDQTIKPETFLKMFK